MMKEKSRKKTDIFLYEFILSKGIYKYYLPSIVEKKRYDNKQK